MGYWIALDQTYHEGDPLTGSKPCSKRPGATYLWNGTQWTEDPTLKANATNAQLKTDLAATDEASIRSAREILTQVARISQWTQAPLTPDQNFLLQYYNQAANLRAQVTPPATPTLADAKLDRIAQLTQQGAAYVQLGFISQTFTWGTKRVFDIVVLTLAGYQVAPLTGDGMVHVWDVNRTERIFAPKDAAKLSGALHQWLYLAQKEYHAAIAAVNAASTVAAVKAYVWTTFYNPTKLFNADTYVP